MVISASFKPNNICRCNYIFFVGKQFVCVHGNNIECRAVCSFLSGGSSWNTTELPELQDDITSNPSFEAGM